MPAGALALADYPSEIVVLECTRCGWHGQYRKWHLVAQYGAEVPLPVLRACLAADCPRLIKPTGNIACGAVYPELAAQAPDAAR